MKHVCPLIYNYISDYHLEISELNQMLQELEDKRNELESMDNKENEINQLNNDIDEFHTAIKNKEEKIKSLDDDRSTIVWARDVGIRNRQHILELTEQSLILHNNQIFICINDIINHNIIMAREDFPLYLNNSHADIVANYEKIVEWSQRWSGCGELILNHISTNIIKLPIGIKDKEDFSILIPKIEMSVLDDQELSVNEQNYILKLFPDIVYVQDNQLNIEKLKEIYFYYLNK